MINKRDWKLVLENQVKRDWKLVLENQVKFIIVFYTDDDSITQQYRCLAMFVNIKVVPAARAWLHGKRLNFSVCFNIYLMETLKKHQAFKNAASILLRLWFSNKEYIEAQGFVIIKSSKKLPVWVDPSYLTHAIHFMQ